MRVLVIEDNAMLGQAVRDGLSADYAVDWVKTASDARSALATTSYELILLDIGLPDASGLDLLRGLRKAGNSVPVLIVTARDRIDHRIEGLDAGADDYLVKPFDLHELLARCRALLRRAHSPGSSRRVAPDLDYDPTTRRIEYKNRPVHLSGREMSVFDRLVSARGGIVSKSQIEDSLYEWGSEAESNTVEVHISAIRAKTSRDVIRTVRGLGYRLATEE